MFEFIFFSLIGAGAFFYWRKKDNELIESIKQSYKEPSTKITDLDDDDEDIYTMVFDVVGESFKNDDGGSRQEIIDKYVEELEPAHLKFYNYKGELACGVFVDSSHVKQVGNIPKDEVAELYDLVTSDATISPIFYEKKGGAHGHKFGVTIEILIKED